MKKHTEAQALVRSLGEALIALDTLGAATAAAHVDAAIEALCRQHCVVREGSEAE